MRKLFDELRGQIEAFLDQRDQNALIVQAGVREHVALCGTLEALSLGGSPHVFLTFGDPFEAPVQYGSALFNTFELKHKELAQAVKPELPRALFDDRTPAVPRVRQLLTFARELMAERTDLLLVVSLVPREIRAAQAFATFVDELLQADPFAPWCRNMRFILREDAGSPELSRSRARRTQARYYTSDMGDAALVRELENEANNEALPTAQRMQSLLILAGMDSSYRRTDQALEKYNLLAEYHFGMRDLPMLALSLNGLGEACALAGRRDEARAHFERALTPALQAKDVPSLINITFNLAHLHQALGEWTRAHEYLSSLSVLARASLNAALQVQCLEQLGTCARKAGSVDDALKEWRAGVTLTEGLGMHDQQLGFLRRIREVIAERGRTSEVREIDRQMEELRRAGGRELQL